MGVYVRAYVFLRADEDEMVSASDCGCEEILVSCLVCFGLMVAFALGLNASHSPVSRMHKHTL